MIAIRRIFGAKKYFHPMIQPKSIHAKCSHDIQESEPRDWRSLRFFYGKQSGLLTRLQQAGLLCIGCCLSSENIRMSSSNRTGVRYRSR